MKGTHTALVTPFTSDGTVDTNALDSLLQRQIDAGVEGIVILGTTGESPTITHDEFRSIVSQAVSTVGDNATITVGTGSNNTQKTIELSKEAKELGAHALLVVNPYYNKPTQEGLYQHFMAIANAVDLPQIVYNIKGRTAVNIETPTLVRLAAHANIVGVKEASGDLGQMMDVIQQTPSDFFVLSGDDGMTFPLISCGGHGVVSVLSNLVPGKVKALVDAALADDVRTARSLHYELLPLMNGCFLETNPIPIKTALAHEGSIQEEFRLPMTRMGKAAKEEWIRIVEKEL